jgi:hypothetical protein
MSEAYHHFHICAITYDVTYREILSQTAPQPHPSASAVFSLKNTCSTRFNTIHIYNVVMSSSEMVRIRARIRQLRRRILRLLILSNPDCFDETNRLKRGRLPKVIPDSVRILLNLIRRAECKLFLLRARRTLPRHSFATLTEANGKSHTLVWDEREPDS